MPRSKKQIIVSILAVGFILGCSNPKFDVWRADRFASSSRESSREAVQLYKKALQALPFGQQKNEVRLKLGKLYRAAGDYSAAVEQFRQLDTREAKVLFAQALYKNSDFTGALEVFNKLGDKGDAEYLYFYGLTLEKNNLYDQAIRIYADIQADPVLKQKAQERIAAISLNSARGAYAGIDAKLKKIIQESPDQKKYPEASGLYLLLDENIYLTEDYRLISDIHYVVKILNDRGKERFAEVILTYDSTFEKLELEYARTIKPDGTVVTVGDKNIRDVSLYLNFPLYSNARARIISMPEVTPDCVIEYKAKLYRSQLPNKKDFDTAYWLQMDEPILAQKCTINVPKNRNLRFKIINDAYNAFGFDLRPKVTEEGERKIFSLEFKDVPQIIPEPSMPPMPRINPYILFSTFESWQDIYTWWRDLYKDKIIPDEDIKAKVHELIKGKSGLEEKTRVLYNFCAQEIRYVAVEYGNAGYEPHEASEIFKNKYGDCKDKAILLISMLGVAGIESFPVLISTSDSLDVQEDLPTLLFDHAIAATKMGEELVFMDATGTTVSFSDLPFSDQGRTTLIFFKDRYELNKTPLFEPEHNKVSTRMKIKVKEDESISGEREIETHGAFEQAQRYWLKFTMPLLIEEGLKQKVRSIADNAVLEDYEIKNVKDLDKTVLLKYTFNAPQYFVRAGPVRIMDQLESINTSVVFKEARHYPIESPGLDFQEERIEVELPTHLAVKYLPPPVEVDTKWFYFINKYEVLDKRLLRFYFASKTKEKVVSVKDYPEFKKVIEEIASSVNQHVVLEETLSHRR